MMKNRLQTFKSIVRLVNRKYSSPSQKTALYDFHVQNNGKMVDFGGYLLPVQYANMSIIASHLHTRERASLFDVSHMLQTDVKGSNAIDFMESLCTADIRNLADGTGTLTVFTNERGGIEDDLIVTKITPEHLYVVSNAARRRNDIELMLAGLNKFRNIDVEFYNTENRALLAVQGPLAAQCLAELITTANYDLTTLKFMQSASISLAGIDCRVTRCGYTGEDGFEISVNAAKSRDLAAKLLKNDAMQLAGLGARDSLRLEAGLCLYGNDIDATTTPIEAGLTWLVAKRRRAEENFPGASRIVSQIKSGVQRKRVGLTSKNGPAARAHASIHVKTDNTYVEIGHVTSGGPSPSCAQNIAMGYVSQEFAKAGVDVYFKIRDRYYNGVTTKMPFVKTNYFVANK